MTTILWSEAVPSGTSLVAQAPSFWRSEMTSIAVGLSPSLLWDGSGGASAESRGLLQPGASRTYFALDSASSQSGPSPLGRAFFASDRSDLLLYESNGTFRVGAPTFLEYGSGSSLSFAPSNVSLFREMSGFTIVSNVTSGAVNVVNVMGGNANSAQLFCNVTCSERSVLFNVFDANPGFRDSLSIYYGGATGAPSTATFYWVATILTVGANNPSGAAL